MAIRAANHRPSIENECIETMKRDIEMHDTHEQEARELGREAGRAAGSWAADGNTSADHIRRMLKLMDDCDARVDDFLPDYPNLSGQWADDLTPVGLWEDITGRDHTEAEDDAGLGYETLVGAHLDALANAWEDGVAETFMEACEATLRAFLPADTSDSPS